MDKKKKTKEGEPVTETTKSEESHDEYISKLYGAFHDKYDWNLSVVSTYDEYIVVWDRNEKSHYKVGYTRNDEEFEFQPRTEWGEVKLKKEWVQKFLAGEHLSLEDYTELEEEEQVNYLHAIKTLGENRVGAYAVLWGDEDNLDLHGEYFTPKTKDLTTIFDAMGVLPFIVHHAGDDGVEKFVGGAVDVLEADDVGLWFEAKTKEFEAYQTYVKPLINKEIAFTSSGTLPAAKRSNKDTGEITRWPISEVSATWTPAEWRMLEHPISEVKSYFKELGVDAELPQYDTDDKAESGQEEQETPGTEKARLTELVAQEFAKLDLLKFEITGD